MPGLHDKPRLPGSETRFVSLYEQRVVLWTGEVRRSAIIGIACLLWYSVPVRGSGLTTRFGDRIRTFKRADGSIFHLVSYVSWLSRFKGTSQTFSSRTTCRLRAAAAGSSHWSELFREV